MGDSLARRSVAEAELVKNRVTDLSQTANQRRSQYICFHSTLSFCTKGQFRIVQCYIRAWPAVRHPFIAVNALVRAFLNAEHSSRKSNAHARRPYNRVYEVLAHPLSCTHPNRIIYSKSHTHPQHVRCALPSMPRLHSPSLRMSMEGEATLMLGLRVGMLGICCVCTMHCGRDLSHIIVNRKYGKARNHRGQKTGAEWEIRFIRPVACRRQKAGWPIPPFQPYHTVQPKNSSALVRGQKACRKASPETSETFISTHAFLAQIFIPSVRIVTEVDMFLRVTYSCSEAETRGSSMSKILLCV